MFWVLNTLMYLMMIFNPPAYQQMVAAGDPLYSCMQSSPNGGLMPATGCQAQKQPAAFLARR